MSPVWMQQLMKEMHLPTTTANCERKLRNRPIHNKFGNALVSGVDLRMYVGNLVIITTISIGQLLFFEIRLNRQKQI